MPGLDALDGVFTSIMSAHGIPGGVLAIAHGGALKMARGDGYADLRSRTPMRPETFVALWGKDGGLGGIQTHVEHLAIGANYVLLFNSAPRQQGDTGALALVKPQVIQFIQRVCAWPEGDLFAQFR